MHICHLQIDQNGLLFLYNQQQGWKILTTTVHSNKTLLFIPTGKMLMQAIRFYTEQIRYLCTVQILKFSRTKKIRTNIDFSNCDKSATAATQNLCA